MADLVGRGEVSGAVVRTIGALPRTHFLGLDFVDASYPELAAELDRLTRSDSLSLVLTAKVDHIVVLNRNSEDEIASRFRRAYSSAPIVTCDSRVLQALAWFRGVSLGVLTGADLTAFLFEEGWMDDRKVAVIGGDGSMLADLAARYPAVVLAQHIPPMGVLNDPLAVALIEDFIERGRFDYVLFAIGTPRSEIIAYQCVLKMRNGGVVMSIGASIEFLLGRKPRAPQFLRFLRMEWAFRLLTEPRRLWRRYLVSGPRIFLIVGRWRKP